MTLPFFVIYADNFLETGPASVPNPLFTNCLDLVRKRAAVHIANVHFAHWQSYRTEVQIKYGADRRSPAANGACAQARRNLELIRISHQFTRTAQDQRSERPSFRGDSTWIASQSQRTQ